MISLNIKIGADGIAAIPGMGMAGIGIAAASAYRWS